MKPIKSIKWILGIVALGGTVMPFTACDKSYDGPIVDLRYDVLDVYELPHTDPQVVTLRVRSLYTPWEIVGSDADADWYEITPSRGEAGETAIVTITCKNNPDLDDREDMINIKSDYWTGKQFRLFQKGTAFLEAEGKTLDMDGEEYEFEVHSNQKWSAAVTEGDAWLSITAGDSGENEGTVNIKAAANKSARRPGVVTLYDRYDRPTVDVLFTQDGVVLDWYMPYDEDPEPDEPEVDWIRCYYDDENIVIPVEFNNGWTAVKSDEDDEWYSIEKGTFERSEDGKTVIKDNLTITLTENGTQRLRTGSLILTSIPESEDAIPVVREVVFKQAYNPESIEIYGRQEIMNNSSVRVKTTVEAGRYDFVITGYKNKIAEINFIFPDQLTSDGSGFTLGFWTSARVSTAGVLNNDGVPVKYATPYIAGYNANECGNYSTNANPGTYAVFDKSQRHTYTMELQKSKREIDGEFKIWARMIWRLDGELLHLGDAGQTQKSILETLDAANWKEMSFAKMTAESSYIQVRGELILEKATFTPPINWGN